MLVVPPKVTISCLLKADIRVSNLTSNTFMLTRATMSRKVLIPSEFFFCFFVVVFLSLLCMDSFRNQIKKNKTKKT